MGKYLIAVVVLMLACGPAMAATIEHKGTQGDVSVELVIAEFAQVVWPGADSVPGDLKIEFGSPDWWNAALEDGTAYAQVTAPPNTPDWAKSPEDAWAGYNPGGLYYEDNDGVHIYVTSNTDMSLDIADNGDLKNGDSDEIETWFTLCAARPGGALIDGKTYNNSTGTGDPGTYFDESGSDLVITGANGVGWPNQDAVPLDASGSWKVSLGAPLECTLTFHARIHRQGLKDAAGTYTTTLGLTFSAP